MELNTLLSKLASAQGSDLYVLPEHAPMMATPQGFLPAHDSLLETQALHTMLQALLNPLQKEQLLDHKQEVNLALERPEGRFRLNVYWQRNALACVARFIPPEIPEWQSLGLPALTQQVLDQQQGLVLFVGASGSGKSTSMASVLAARSARHEGHIVTVEDPIEFLHKNQKSLFSQREVGLDTVDHGAALKNVLRQAPHVVMIGEIRDTAVLQHALNFAQTGHLCMSTFHASSALHALERMVHWLPQEQQERLRYDLSLNLKTIYAQKLLPGVEDGERVLAVEVLQCTPHLQNLIRQGAFSEIKEFLQQSDDEAMIGLDHALKKLVLSGRISRATALQHAASENNLRIALDYQS